MEITEVRIKLTEDSDDRLQAFCSITFDDCFVIRDLKIIEGTNGPFVAMPSRKLTAHCPRCGTKNHLRANHCNQCGGKLNPDRASREHEGRAKLYADIAHPINSECREIIQERVIAEYEDELDLSKQPGYVSRYEDSYDDDDYVPEPRNSATESPKQVGIDKPDIQPPTSEPRAPHAVKRSEPQQPRGTSGESGRKTTGDFGAGIFEE